MNLIEIKDAAFNGKTFTLKNVHLESIEFGSIQTCIDNFGNPVLVKTATVKFVSPDIIDSVYNEEKDYPNIEITEQPKYDPCRLFKKGDVVKIRSVFGRKIYIDDVLYEVVWDESCNKISIKKLTSDETLVGMSSVFFELVTPVEERSPYYVKETASVYEVFNRNENNSSVAIFFKSQYSIEKAKECAEAERDRLNAEYRKEQK